MNNIRSQLSDYADIINEKLSFLVPEVEAYQRKIYEAMRYSLLLGGKRIRPVIAIETCKMFGGEMEEVLPFACAIEMIHTYSLIHDDLPAMDNDDFRRGKLTNHKVYGDGIAVLAGDALLNKAFELMIKNLEDNKNLERKIEALNVIAKASGTEGMIGGQVIDIESEGKQIDADILKKMHNLKTGALISAAAVAGAIIGGASKDDIKSVNEYASNIGLAFQIKDDILSETGDQIILGKKVGNDRERNKSTYVTIIGLEESKALLNEVTKLAIESIERTGEKSKFLVDLAYYLLERDK